MFEKFALERKTDIDFLNCFSFLSDGSTKVFIVLILQNNSVFSVLLLQLIVIKKELDYLNFAQFYDIVCEKVRYQSNPQTINIIWVVINLID